MKATINGFVIEGTPDEIISLINLSSKTPKAQNSMPVIPTEPKRTLLPPAGIGSHSGAKGATRNPFGNKGKPIVTVSMINSTRVKYKSVSSCARSLNIERAKIYQVIDTPRCYSGYYFKTDNL